MGTRSERNQVKAAMLRRVKKDLAMINEIKGFPFRVRLTIAWQIVRGNR